MISASIKKRHQVGLSITNLECECIADGMRGAGFELPDDFSNDDIALLAQIILDALCIEGVDL